MRAKAPAFQVYAADFLTGTMGMSLEAQGAYWRLICWSWTLGGGLPNDPQQLARGLGISLKKFRSLFPKVSEKFTLISNKWCNPRLEEVRAVQDCFREKQAIKGRKSAEARAVVSPKEVNRGSLPVDVRLQPEGNSSSSSSKDQDQEQDQERVPPSAARTHAAVTTFQRCHLDRLGTKATMEPKDVRRLMRFMADRQGDPVTADSLIAAFFASQDPFILRAGFTVNVFLSQIGRLLPQIAISAAPREHWRDECARLHNARCENPHFHSAMMSDVRKAAS
jgi:uncharacterized protein YdaU (DUF1376 family)